MTVKGTDSQTRPSVLPYFPELYPDELLVSAIGRYRRVAGASLSSALLQLTGSMVPSWNYGLPPRIRELARAIPDERALTCERLLHEHTLLRYYAAGGSSDLYQKYVEAEETGTPMQSDLGSPIKFTKLPGKRLRNYRFCTACASEMLQRHGELYWNRLHQLPLVMICTRHDLVLRTSVPTTVTRKLDVYLPASRRVCPPDAPEVFDVDGSEFEALRRFAVLSVAVAEGRVTFPAEPSPTLALFDELRRTYPAPEGRLDLHRLSQDLRACYGSAAPAWPKVFPATGLPVWLDIMWESREAWNHPFKHILIRTFMEAWQDEPSMRPKSSMGEKPKWSPRRKSAAGGVDPFPGGSWPCLNRLCVSFERATASVIQLLDWDGGTRGFIACHCGYTYSQTVTRDRQMSAPHFRSPGHLLLPFLKMARSKRWSLDRILSATGYSVRRLNSLASEYGLSLPGVSHDPSLRSRRASQRSNQGSKADSPAALKRAAGKVARASEDEALLELVRARVAEILTMRPPRRVSLGLIGYVGRIRHRLPALPHVADFLREHLETREQHAYRQATYLVAVARNGGREPELASIVKRMKGRYKPQIRLALGLPEAGDD
jgi:hypothetical protein